MGEYVLEMNNITKVFPGVKALDGVTLKVRPGSVHALMGENGAGKSTLMKCSASTTRMAAKSSWMGRNRSSIRRNRRWTSAFP